MAEDAKDYFANIDDHRRYFKWSGEIDSSTLEVCFAKDKLNSRNSWILRTMDLKLQNETEVCWKPLSLESFITSTLAISL
jgi:DNA topoisomerase-2